MPEVNKKRIIDKIAKCLRLSASSNPHEAAMALKQAQSLMEKYGVTDSEVDTASISESQVTSGSSCTPPGYLDRLASIISNSYGVYHFLSLTGGANKYTFVGPDPIPEVASYVFTVLRRQVTKARKEYYKTRRGKRVNKIKKADVFAMGWVISVSELVNDFAQPLKVKEAINKYLDIYHPGLTKYTPRNIKIKAGNIDAALSGMSAGQNANLKNGVNSTTRPLLNA